MKTLLPTSLFTLLTLSLGLSSLAQAGGPTKLLTTCKLPPNALVGETRFDVKQEINTAKYFAEARAKGNKDPEYTGIESMTIVQRSQFERDPVLQEYLRVAGLKAENILSARNYHFSPLPLVDGGDNRPGILVFKGGRGITVGQIFYLEAYNEQRSVKCK